MSKYDGMTDREIDTLVAERVMGWRLVRDSERGYWNPLSSKAQLPDGEHWPRRYSTDDNAARLVRGRIAELGQIAEYPMLDGPDPFGFQLLQATPRKQCIAALMALDETK